jgi:flagellar FliJ protein
MAKTFQFRLEKLLDLRRTKEDVAQRELAAARQAVEIRNRVILDLMDREEQAKADLRDVQQAGALHVDRLRLATEFLGALERQLRREYETLQELVKTEIAARERLSQAKKDVRVLEKQREKELGRHRQGVDREERRFLDEIGGNFAKGA